MSACAPGMALKLRPLCATPCGDEHGRREPSEPQGGVEASDFGGAARCRAEALNGAQGDVPGAREGGQRRTERLEGARGAPAEGGPPCAGAHKSGEGRRDGRWGRAALVGARQVAGDGCPWRVQGGPPVPRRREPEGPAPAPSAAPGKSPAASAGPGWGVRPPAITTWGGQWRGAPSRPPNGPPPPTAVRPAPEGPRLPGAGSKRKPTSSPPAAGPEPLSGRKEFGPPGDSAPRISQPSKIFSLPSAVGRFEGAGGPPRG